jgi:hypothetical protein
MPSNKRRQARIPEEWEKAAKAVVATSPPLTDEQRRGLTRVASQYARRKQREATDSD